MATCHSSVNALQVLCLLLLVVISLFGHMEDAQGQGHQLAVASAGGRLSTASYAVLVRQALDA